MSEMQSDDLPVTSKVDAGLGKSSTKPFDTEFPYNQEKANYYFNTRENAKDLEETLSHPNTQNKSPRPHVVAVSENDALFIKDGNHDMAAHGRPYKSLHPNLIGNRVLYTMYAGTSGYGSKDHLRMPQSPLQGEFVLVWGTGQLQAYPGGEGEQLISSWNGPTARVLYAQSGENDVVQLVDPKTDKVIISDVNHAPIGIATEVIVDMGKAKPPQTPSSPPPIG